MKVWNFVRKHVEWFYALACIAAGAYAFANGDQTGGWVCLGIAVAVVAALKLLYATVKRVDSYEDYNAIRKDADDLAKLGLEPLPIPGEETTSYCGYKDCRVHRQDWGKK